jgi:tetratricopeptide (TPR) repeat protein
MNRPFSPLRRAALACVSCVLAAMLFRGQIAAALVVRGDELLFRGDLSGAAQRYRRALIVDAGSATATDRYVFVQMRMRTAASIADGVNVATKYLRHTADAPILADRALCYLIQRDYAGAQRDFEEATALTRDPAYAVFAGWAAHRRHRVREARALWRFALHLRRGYVPAEVALAGWRR